MVHGIYKRAQRARFYHFHSKPGNGGIQTIGLARPRSGTGLEGRRACFLCCTVLCSLFQVPNLGVVQIRPRNLLSGAPICSQPSPVPCVLWAGLSAAETIGALNCACAVGKNLKKRACVRSLPGCFIRFLRPGSDVTATRFSIFSLTAHAQFRAPIVSGALSPAHSANRTRDFFFRLSAYGGA